MSDARGTRPGPNPPASRSAEDRLHRDLEALGARSRREPRSLDETIHTLSARRAGGSWEERLMASFGSIVHRPRVAVLAVAAVLALALLVVPISYERTVGHTVALEIDGAGLSQEALTDIAGRMKAVLGVEQVLVDASGNAEGADYTLRAEVPGRSARSALAASEAFRRTLTGKGYEVATSVTPVKERVSGNVYAMVLDNTIRVSIDGKSAAEIEEEIASALAASGIPDADVSVTLDDGHMEVSVRAEATGEDLPEGGPARIVLTRDGRDLGGDLHEEALRMKKVKDAAGNVQLVLEMTKDGRTVTAVVEDPDSMTDAELAAEVSRQLEAAGFTGLSVSSQDGRVSVLDTSNPGVAPTEEESSWGGLKRKAGSN